MKGKNKMSEHMNPNYPTSRGCFIELNKETDKCKVVDYPTWSIKNGRWTSCTNDPIPDGAEYEKEFDSKESAYEWCKSENYVICAYPKSDEELAEIKAKRDAWAASHADEVNERDAFEDALDM